MAPGRPTPRAFRSVGRPLVAALAIGTVTFAVVPSAGAAPGPVSTAALTTAAAPEPTAYQPLPAWSPSAAEPVVAASGSPPPAPAATPPLVTTTAKPGTAARVAIDFALAQRGLPYVWGGDGPGAGEAGFDCSGLTTAAYAAAGITLPRTAHTQFYAGPHVPDGALLEPGDLVFYGVPARVHHVGLYLGDGLMVNAPTFGKPVQIAYVRYPGDDYLGATRPAAGRDTPGLLTTPDLPYRVPSVPEPDAPKAPTEFPAPAAPVPAATTSPQPTTPGPSVLAAAEGPSTTGAAPSTTGAAPSTEGGPSTTPGSPTSDPAGADAGSAAATSPDTTPPGTTPPGTTPLSAAQPGTAPPDTASAGTTPPATTRSATTTPGTTLPGTTPPGTTPPGVAAAGSPTSSTARSTPASAPTTAAVSPSATTAGAPPSSSAPPSPTPSTTAAAPTTSATPAITAAPVAPTRLLLPSTGTTLTLVAAGRDASGLPVAPAAPDRGSLNWRPGSGGAWVAAVGLPTGITAPAVGATLVLTGPGGTRTTLTVRSRVTVDAAAAKAAVDAAGPGPRLVLVRTDAATGQVLVVVAA